MLKKENMLLPFSIVFLGGCIVFSAWLVSKEIENTKSVDQTFGTHSTKKALMTPDEAADYMGISLDEFNLLIETQVKQQAGLRSYDTYRFIPYIKIGNDKYFAEMEINKWIEYNMLNK